MANEAKLNLVITARDEAKQVLEELVNNLKAAFDGLNNLTANVNFATAFEEQFTRMVSATEQNTSEIRLGFERMATGIEESTNQISQSLERVNQAGQHLNESLDFQNLQMAGQMIQDVGEQITGFFEHAVSSAADFDQSVVNTTASLDANMGSVKLNTEQIKSMQDAAIQMGESGFYSANMVQEAMNTMAKQGIDYQTIMSGGIQTVYKVAAANQADLESTANVVSDIYNEMGDEFKKAGMTAQQSADEIGNAMTVALHHARISMDDFMATMRYVGPQASAMGVGIKDLSAMIALLGQHGIRSSQAGTTLRRMLTNLTPSTKEATAEMKSLGMITKDGSNIFYDSAGKMKPLAEVQQLLHDKLAALNPEQEQFAIKTIFGQYALAGMTAVANTAPSKFQGLTAAMNNNNIMTDIMAEKSKGLGLEIQKLNAHWQTVQKTIGEALKPVVESLISGLNRLMKAWEGLSPGVQRAIVIIGAVTGVLLLVGGGFLALIGTVGMFVTAFSAGMAVLSAVAVPALIVAGILAIVAIVAVAAYEIHKHWSQISSFLQQTWTTISNTAISIWSKLSSSIGDFVSQTVTTIQNIWSGAVSWISGAAQEFVNIPVQAFQWLYNHNYYFQDLVDFIRKTWQQASAEASSIWNSITSTLTSLWSSAVSVGRSVWTSLSSFFSSLWSSIRSAVSSAWSSITSTISSQANAAVSAARGPFESLGSFFSGLASQAFQWGSNMVNMIGNGIRSAASSVVSAAKSVASSIASFLGFHSPTREGPGSDADTWAPNFVNMMAKGIQEHTPQIQAAVNGIALSMKTGVTSVSNTVQRNQITVPNTQNNQKGTTNIYIQIDGRSAKTDRELTDMIANKFYKQMGIVSV